MPALTTTHDFFLLQGHRLNDQKYITSHSTDTRLGIPTQHGDHLMRSRLETQWAGRFEKKGFTQAPYGVASSLPCYFYEPSGMKRWPSYPKGHHYRIDFILVREVETISLDGVQRSRAVRWEWISIKPAYDLTDIGYLQQLVLFDSRHQRAFQCIGPPDECHHTYQVLYNPLTQKCDVK